LRAVIYTRVSTGQQAEEGTSLEVQEAVCLKKAQEMGAGVMDIISDEGISGAFYLSRPGIQKALSLIEAGEANLLITMKLDRSGRDVDALRLIRKRVTEAGGKLVFADGMNFENNAVGNLMFTQLAGFAEYEREVIRERTMNGRRRRAEEGRQPSRSISPYGYHIVTKPDVMAGHYPQEELGTYQVVETQAQIVRRLFVRYAGGASLGKLCRELNSEGIPMPRGGEYWRRCAVQRILRNPVYKGTPVFGRYATKTDEKRAADGRKVTYVVEAEEANWIVLQAPALIDEQTFERCQKRLAEGRTIRSGNPNRVHMLSVLIRCPVCGKAMAGKWVKRVYKSKETQFDHFYNCRNAYRSSNPGGAVCINQTYRADDMERLTCDAVRTVAKRPELVEKALNVYKRRREGKSAEEESISIQKALKEIEARERATIEAQVAGIMAGASAAVYANLLKEIAKEREELQAKLNQLEQQADASLDSSQLSCRLAGMFSAVDEALTAEEITPAERRKLLSGIIRTITPKKDETGEWGVLITLRSPVPQKAGSDPLQIVWMISTLARGTVTSRPSCRRACSTRTIVSDSTLTSSGGSPVTVPRIPK
jgi:site-specific DNA recombinase